MMTIDEEFSTLYIRLNEIHPISEIDNKHACYCSFEYSMITVGLLPMLSIAKMI